MYDLPMATNDLLQKISAAVADYRRMNPGSTELPAELALAVEAGFELNDLLESFDGEIVDAEILTDEESAAFDARISAPRASFSTGRRQTGFYDRSYFTLPTTPAKEGPYLSRAIIEGQMAQRNGILINAMA